ncbi:MAG: lysine--tRNA ligase [Candidatus Puniceispirillaceae bacterium]
MPDMTSLHATFATLAQDAKAWPFAEARAVIKRLAASDDDGQRPVVFETGYGPSGLPHIGTFGEVVRTSMVRLAFEVLTGRKTRLICFSDDMDGLRKVPDNVPNREMLSDYIDQPLTKVPDPFGDHPSFGEHNNARLCAFLDSFGFDYEFMSATTEYKSGRMDSALLDILKHYEAVRDIILPTLGEERRKTYSPFLPICPTTGRVLQAKVIATNPDAGTISYEDPDNGAIIEVPVTGGACKLQWKCDWAMRWYALGVDYEMSGKDLIDSVNLSSKIVRVLGKVPPTAFSYELFLDQNGEKISKSKGNGLSIEEWLRYGSPESLALFMYGQPKRAKRLYFDSIPKAVDEYFAHLRKLPDCEPQALLENPAWHIQRGDIAVQDMPVSFSLLLNLAAVCQAETAEVIWGYVSDYAPDVTRTSHPVLDDMIAYAVNYYQDLVRPHLRYRAATEAEKQILASLRDVIAAQPSEASGEELQSCVYAAGKQAGYENLRDWFSCLYETMLGQSQGPRMGGFFRLYGRDKTLALFDDVLHDRLVSQ